MADKIPQKVLGILGPTGVGKTSIAIELCSRLKGEIISCDSRQIYKDLDIGTAKPSREELKQAKHHLIDIVEIGEDFSAYEFRNLAEPIIEGLIEKGMTPLVVGGTGLYYRSLTEGLFETPPRDKEFRNEMQSKVEKHGSEYLWKELEKIDPEAAYEIPVQNVVKIIRALEIIKTSGKTKSELKKSGNYPESRYNYVTIGLNLEREVLYSKINQRVDKMLKKGWMEETEKLIKDGRLKSENIRKFMGYNYLYDCIRGRLESSEAVEKIKQAHRNYAKRQITWFKKVRNIVWIDVDDGKIMDRIIETYNKQ